MTGGKGKVRTIDDGSERERILSKPSSGVIFVLNPRRLHRYSTNRLISFVLLSC